MVDNFTNGLGLSFDPFFGAEESNFDFDIDHDTLASTSTAPNNTDPLPNQQTDHPAQSANDAPAPASCSCTILVLQLMQRVLALELSLVTPIKFGDLLSRIVQLEVHNSNHTKSLEEVEERQKRHAQNLKALSDYIKELEIVRPQDL